MSLKKWLLLVKRILQKNKKMKNEVEDAWKNYESITEKKKTFPKKPIII